MTWLLIGIAIWLALAAPLALLLGRSIRLADARRAMPLPDGTEVNFIATDDVPADVPPAETVEQPWTGPATVPFAPSRLPWGGERTSAPRPRPPVIRHPVKPVERDPGARDSGMT